MAKLNLGGKEVELNQSDELPEFEGNPRIDVTQEPNFQGETDRLISALQSGTTGVGQLSQSALQQMGQERRETLHTNIAQTMQQFAQDALESDDPDKALQNYDRQAKMFSQSLIGNLNAANKPYAKNLLNHYANQERSPLFRKKMQMDQTRRQANLYESLRTGRNSILESIHSADPQISEFSENNNKYAKADALLTDQIRALNNAAKNGTLSPATANAQILHLQKTAAQNKVLKGADDALERDEFDDYFNKFQQSNIQGLDETDKSALSSKMLGKAHQKLVSQGLDADHINTQLKQEKQQVLQDGTPANNKLVNDFCKLNPEKCANEKRDIMMRQKAYDYAISMQQMSPQQKQNFLNRINISQDEDDQDNLTRRTLLGYIQKADSHLEQQVQNNPTAVFNHTMMARRQANEDDIQENAGFTPDQFKGSSLKPGTPGYVNKNVHWQINKGRTLSGDKKNRVKPLENTVAQQFVADFNDASPNEKIQLLQQKRQELGPWFMLGMQQLEDQGLPKGAALLSQIDANDPEARVAAQAIDTPLATLENQAKQLDGLDKSDQHPIADKINSVNADATPQTDPVTGLPQGSILDLFKNTDYQQELSEYLSSYNQFGTGTNAQFNQDVKNTIKKIAYQKKAQGIDDDSAAEQATRLVTGRFNYPQLDGQILRVPKHYDPNRIKNEAAQARLEVDQQNWQLKSNIPGFDNPKDSQEFDAKRINQGHFTTNERNDGLVWVDSLNRKRLRQDGSPLEISYDDLSAGTRTSKSFSEQLREGQGILDPNIVSVFTKKRNPELRETLKNSGVQSLDPEGDNDEIVQGSTRNIWALKKWLTGTSESQQTANRIINQLQTGTSNESFNRAAQQSMPDQVAQRFERELKSLKER